jgi:hypothetical protein
VSRDFIPFARPTREYTSSAQFAIFFGFISKEKANLTNQNSLYLCPHNPSMTGNPVHRHKTEFHPLAAPTRKYGNMGA